jgi:hypothetical protein
MVVMVVAQGTVAQVVTLELVVLVGAQEIMLGIGCTVPPQ